MMGSYSISQRTENDKKTNITLRDDQASLETKIYEIYRCFVEKQWFLIERGVVRPKTGAQVRHINWYFKTKID